jgi:hypothetical protein
MAGPYPPPQGTGPHGPYSQPHPSQPYPASPAYHGAYANLYPSAPYAPAGPLPPAMPYPKRRRWRWVAAALVTVVVIAGLVTAIVVTVRGNSAQQNAVVTAASSQRAIQTYLDALSKDDVETIARNSLCGLYDGVKDRRSDDALATLSADAFQKQFSSVQVTSVDTIVFASPTAAQVLFTMKVVPAGSTRGPGNVERQGVAQVLAYNDEILVCSYVLRTAGMF